MKRSIVPNLAALALIGVAHPALAQQMQPQSAPSSMAGHADMAGSQTLPEPRRASSANMTQVWAG